MQGSSDCVEDLQGSGLRGVEIVLAAREEEKLCFIYSMHLIDISSDSIRHCSSTHTHICTQHVCIHMQDIISCICARTMHSFTCIVRRSKWGMSGRRTEAIPTGAHIDSAIGCYQRRQLPLAAAIAKKAPRFSAA